MRNNYSLRIGATCIAMAGLGAAAALLLAPQAGSRTRRQIQRTARCYWGSLTHQLEDAQNLLSKGRSTADVAARQLSRKLKVVARVA
jgi:gas vesicle protein